MEMSVVDRSRLKFIGLILVMSFVQALIFLVDDLLTPPSEAKDLIFNGGTIIITAMLYGWSRKVGDIELFAKAITGAVMFALIYLAYTAVNPFIAGMFLPMFPLVAFFLRGKKEGMGWLALFLLVMAAYFLAAYVGVVDRAYLLSSGILIQIVNLVLYVAVIYFYVDVEDKSRVLLADQTDRQDKKRLTYS